MAKRASRRRGQIFVDGIEFKRFCSGLGKALNEQFQISVKLDPMMEIVARAAGFKTFRDLVLEANSNVRDSSTTQSPSPTTVIQEPLAFGPIGRQYGMSGSWLSHAKHEFGAAFEDAKPSGALAVAVVGSTRGTRLAAASAAATREDAIIFDLNVSTETELANIDRTTKSVVVFDRVRTDDGSSTWAIAFARRHYDKTVILLVEDGEYQKLISLNDDKRASQFGWRLNVVHLELPRASWGNISQPARTEAADLNSI